MPYFRVKQSILFTISIVSCLIVLSSAKEYYVAAVVEHSPVFKLGDVNRDEALNIMNQNLNIYEQQLSTISNNTEKVQIVVFPEDGLYGPEFPTRKSVQPYLEPVPNVGETPCNNLQFKLSPVTQRLSCLAKKYSTVIVAVMASLETCKKDIDPSCPSDAHYQYNTQLALDESGKILAKYHKSHLFDEDQFDQAKPVPVTFQTSFGVTFGMFICFDVMFEEPQASLYQSGVRDIAFSSWWVNVPPIIMATQVQRASSLLHNTNFLAANSGPSWATSGSGIYSQGKVLQSFFNPTTQKAEKILISRVPILKKSPNSFEKRNLELELFFEADIITTLFPKDQKSGTVQASSGPLNCRVKYSFASQFNESFALLTAKGSWILLKSMEVCLVVRCPGGPSQCGKPTWESFTSFDSLTLEGTFESKHSQLYALASKNGGDLVETEQLNVDTKSGRMSLKGSKDNIANFGFFNTLN